MAKLKLFTKQKQTHRHGEQTCGCQGGGGAGMDGGFGVSSCKLLHLEWRRDEVLLCSTGRYINLLGYNMMEDNITKGNVYIYTYIYICTYIYMTGSFCCTAENGTTLGANYMLHSNKHFTK